MPEDGGHCQCFSCPQCPHPKKIYCNACEGLREFIVTHKWRVTAPGEEEAAKYAWKNFPTDTDVEEVTEDGQTDSDRSDRQD